MKRLFRWRNGFALKMLYLHHKKEAYQKQGYRAMIRQLSSRDDPDVFVWEKEKNHGDFVT